MNVTLLNRSLATMRINSARPFSVAYNVKSKFEAAYEAKMESMSKITQKA